MTFYSFLCSKNIKFVFLVKFASFFIYKSSKNSLNSSRKVLKTTKIDTGGDRLLSAARVCRKFFSKFFLLHKWILQGMISRGNTLFYRGTTLSFMSKKGFNFFRPPYNCIRHRRARFCPIGKFLPRFWKIILKGQRSRDSL